VTPQDVRPEEMPADAMPALHGIPEEFR
jgi:hypothetical protein